MSLSESDLFLDRASVPTVEAVVGRVADHGHAIAFPAGFGLTDESHTGWLPVVVDGEKSGFDYQFFSREAYLGDDPEAPAFPAFGDCVLAFVARRTQTSILTMSLVQRAICELTDAQGWWQEGEEHLDNEEMIGFCTATIEAIRVNPVPNPPARPRFDSAYFRLVGKSLVIFAAVLGGIYLLAALMGYFFAPGAAK